MMRAEEMDSRSVSKDRAVLTTAVAAVTMRERSLISDANSAVILGRLMYSHHFVPGPRAQGHFSIYTTSVPNEAISFSNPFSIPLVTVAIPVTDTIPMMIPSVVSTARILLDHTALIAIKMDSENSKKNRRTGGGSWIQVTPHTCRGRGCCTLRDIHLVLPQVSKIAEQRLPRTDFRSNHPQTLSDMGKLSVLGEFWQFLKVRKKFWLAPILVVLLLLSLVIVLAQGSALAPFIYALF